MSEITVELPDGSSRSLPAGATSLDLAAAIGPRLAKDAVAARVNGALSDLSRPLADGDTVSIVTPASDDGREILRHSSAHVMAQAVTRLWPGAHYAIGPAIRDGFYYDFELPDGAHFSDDDLPKVEAEMRAIVAEDQPFVRHEYSIPEALALFSDQPFKVEIIEGVAAGNLEDLGETGGDQVVSTYQNSPTFVDLCRGPHVPSTARLGYFELTRVAGAYWRGDEKNPQLQRIYGTAWESKEALATHVRQVHEAEARDHRKLGAELDLFSFPGEIGPGLVLFHPKGGIIRRVMEEYSRQRHEVSGYDFVYSPHITKADLFETSGHLTWFAEGMYPPMELDEGQRYYLKPMNCPFHMTIFNARQRSYRELPLRFFEFGSVYRYEKSGVVQGLTRVRGMTQDDAHIFCTRDQMLDELTRTLNFVLDLLRDFGLNDFYLELSTRPPGKAIGSDEDWAEAEAILAQVCRDAGLEFVMDPGGGAFYGPKISVQARDAIGRTHQISTVQLDFQTPQNFDATYVAPDNSRQRPIMIHRALFGSVERFLAILIEHFAGNLPTWLCPEQVRVLGVRDDHDAYAFEVAALLAERGLRTHVDEASEPLGARIRKAKLEKVPYVLVVGDDDVASGTVGVNARGSNDPERGVGVGEFAQRLVDEVARHASPEAP
ncbi:MAG TPA: threonine--tRNA ligase [Acidimicrobiales bacterium]|nr:threonine--tRNA ligase [Acidimicrobiales bacterium]